MPDAIPQALPFLSLLRQETVARLRTVPGVFKNIYDSKLPQLKRDQLPAVRVYTASTSTGRVVSRQTRRAASDISVWVR